MGYIQFTDDRKHQIPIIEIPAESMLSGGYIILTEEMTKYMSAAIYEYAPGISDGLSYDTPGDVFRYHWDKSFDKKYNSNGYSLYQIKLASGDWFSFKGDWYGINKNSDGSISGNPYTFIFYYPGTNYSAGFYSYGWKSLSEISSGQKILLSYESGFLNRPDGLPTGFTLDRDYFLGGAYPDVIPGGESSGIGGGGGSYDNTGDSIGFGNLPSLSAADAGFLKLYAPDSSMLRALANYMWTSDFVSSIKKLFGDPMNAILGLNIVPVVPATSGLEVVSVGYVSTGVSMPPCVSQYIQINCGSLSVPEYWGSALDYAPYTKAQIYLPYCGTHEIDIDDIMGKTISIRYNVDVLSGACVAMIASGGTVLYTYIGHCASTIPVTGQNFAQVISGVLSIAGSAGAFAAAGGISAPITAAAAVSGVMATAGNVMSSKPHIEKSGSVSGSGALMAVQRPYLIITRPRQSRPNGYNKFVGYPCNISYRLGALSGFTSVEDVHLENMSATKPECDEIEQLLKDGVIIR